MIDASGGSMAAAARFGLAFELALECPPDPSGNGLRAAYRYEFASQPEFAHWRTARNLAAFEAVDLGLFAGDKKLEQVWWALARV